MKTCRYCLKPAEDEGPCRIDVPGFPGYMVDCLGVVWSCWNSRWGMTAPWHPLKPRLLRDKPPYAQVALKVGDGNINRYVHTLVLLAFVGPRPDGLEACHNDGDSLNNRRDNLRWDTILANRADSIAHGTFARGVMYPQAKLTDEKVRQLRLRRAAGESPESLAREFGLCKRNVQRAISGDTWSHVK